MTTICAPATANGGAISVLRVSGPDTLDIVSRIFTKDIREAKGYTIHYGQILATAAPQEAAVASSSAVQQQAAVASSSAVQQQAAVASSSAVRQPAAVTASSASTAQQSPVVIDEVLVSVFRAPHSYTGEDSVEISCHASAYIVREILNALIAQGAEAAAPGEFTKRAFMHGKMDLSQAEAVADLIASSNRASHDIAINQLKGGFSSELTQLRQQLLKLTSLLELELDFSDHEDLEFADRSELKQLAHTIADRLQSLAQSFEAGKVIKEGIPVAIVGKTNVGKSTLLNRLLHEDRAIVSDVHGTTRDVIEDTTVINSYTFRFIDTAGIRHTDDTVERLGIERTYEKLHQARIVLWVIDQTPSAEETAEMQTLAEGKQLIVVRNKCDKQVAPISDAQSIADAPTITDAQSIADAPTFSDAPTIAKASAKPLISPLLVSAKENIGIQALEQAIYEAAYIPEISQGDIIVTNARHYDLLCKAHKEITTVIASLDMDLSGDLVAEDLRQVLHTLASITGGEINTAETLSNIFSHFCIGK